ncbi:MAG: T6SS effector amidase Tae4 family protein [Bacteroidia bacterium]
MDSNKINLQSEFFQIGDYDGDGASDFMFIGYEWNYTSPKYKTRITHPRVHKNNGSSSYSYRVNGLATTELTSLEFNGDGKTDILCQNGSTLYIYETTYNQSNYTVTATQLYSGNHQWDKKYPGDFNGDGKTDLLVMSDVWEIAYSTGKAFSLSGISFTNYTDNTDYVRTGDYNGDGKCDILHVQNNQNDWKSYLNFHLSEGNTFAAETFVLNYFVHFTNTLGSGDFNGDGRVEEVDRFDSGDPCKMLYFNRDGQDLRLQRISNGLNQSTIFDYSWLSKATNYIKGSTSTYPLTDIQAPIPVVSTLSTDNGLGGLTTVNFSYEGAIIHRQGRGFLGFSKVTSSNVTSGVKSVQEFSINPTYHHPYLANHKTILSSNSSLISETENTYSFVDRGSEIYWFQTTESITKDYLTGAATKSTIDYDDDNYGNVESATSVIYADLDLTQEVESAVTTSSNFAAYGSWIPASPGTVTVTKERKATNEAPFSRTVEYTYNGNGKIIQEVVFPGLTNNVTTDYSYNSWGLVKDITVSSSGLPTKTEQYEYDLFGRFPTKITNALGQVTKSTFDSRWGKPLSVTGIDGLITTNQYDGFGRLIKNTSPNGVVINSTYGWDIVPNENKLYYTAVQHPGKPDVKTWYDLLGREVVSELDGMNQNKIFIEKSYDSRGNLSAESAPYFENEQPLWTTYSYEDDYNRIEDISDGTRTTAYEYSGSGGQATVAITNPAQQTVTRVSDAAGKLISATDGGGTLSYRYNSAGNLREVWLKTSPVHIYLQTEMKYDANYGYQTELWDKNAGTTTYDYNAYGQLISQEDAEGNEFYDLLYDAVGRMTEKSSKTGTTMHGTYTYEYITSGYGLNQLKKSTAPNGYYQEFIYDQYSRPTQVKEVAGAETFTTSYSYDQYDRLITQTYPSGFAIEHIYDNNGYLTTVKELNGSNIFSAPEVNALGQYTQYDLGNGLTTTRTYDQFGLPKKIEEETGDVFSMEYSFDPSSGNLDWRQDNVPNVNVTEYFNYDPLLNRLENIEFEGSSYDINYESNGNINFKFDAGDYSYHSSKRNAVQEINYTQIQGPQSPITTTQNISYTPFDRTASVTQSSDNFQVDYFYGHDQNRKKAVEVYNGITTTTHYSGSYEKMEIDDGTTTTYEVHYISGGDGLAAIYVKENGTGTMYYAYSDYLGSILTVTDDQGNIVAGGKQSFDAWGRYRNPDDWTYDNISARLPWLKRGFTGHEHLPEAISLINMNNRMYDPVVGRMMAVDNFVVDPAYTQAFNRYSYALNNPLKYSDPDGENPIFIAAAIGAAFFGYIGGVAANDHQINPIKWDWNSGNTYLGIGMGIVTGAFAGAAVYAGGPALAGTGFFSNFGTSGTVAAYSIVGAASGGAAGYLTGFGTGMLVSDGNWNYAHKSGMFYGSIGFGIGTVAGGIYGFISGYEPPPQGYGNIDMSLVASADPYAGVAYQEPGFPNPKTILSNYPAVGEYCNQASDECAIRMSIALSRSGVDLSGSNIFRETHIHNGIIHQPSAAALADYLTIKLGSPTIYNHPTGYWSFDDFSHKAGIIYFVPPGRGGTGPQHIDVISGGSIGSKFYPTKVIWFWHFILNGY